MVTIGGGPDQWPWLARLWHDDQPVGSGFLVDEHHVLTCAHLVADLLGQSAPSGSLKLDFPAWNAGGPMDAEVATGGWHPVKADQTGDLAVLELSTELPPEMRRAPLRQPTSTLDHHFRCHGFPPQTPGGRDAVGVLQGPAGPAWEWVQMNGEGSGGFRVERGFSGSPVWSDEADAVVGMVVAENPQDPTARVSWMIPVRVLVAYWAPLAGLLLGEGPTPLVDRALTRELKNAAASIVLRYELDVDNRFPFGRLQSRATLRAVRNESGQQLDLLQILLARLSDPGTASAPILVLGDYGEGKTRACGALAYELASRLAQGTRGARLPLIVPLREASQVEDLGSDRALAALAADTFQRLYDATVSSTVLDRAVLQGRLILLLDGLDELLARRLLSSAASEGGDELVRRLAAQLGALVSRVKPYGNRMVITSRDTGSVRRFLQGYPQWFDQYTLSKLGPADIQRYLTDRDITDLQRHLATSMRTGVISDLLRRPLFLKMVADSYPVIAATSYAHELTVTEIYQDYVRAWYASEVHKAAGVPELGTVMKILSRVAYEMSIRHTDSIDHPSLSQIIRETLGDASRLRVEQAVLSGKERLILVPDIAAASPGLTFHHDSLRAYFTARYVCDRLREGDIETLMPVWLDDITVDFLLSMAKLDPAASEALDEMYALENAPGRMRADGVGSVLLLWAIRQRVLGDTGYLRHFCENAFGNVRHLIVQNLRGHNLAGLDLSGVNLREALLDGADLRDCNLRGANLTNAELRGARLDHADLTGAILRLASFRNATLHHATLHAIRETDGANFTGADMRQASIQDSVFRRCGNLDVGNPLPPAGLSMPKWSLEEATLRDCAFHECILAGASLQNATIEGDLLFEGCNIQNTILSGIRGQPPRIVNCTGHPIEDMH